MFSVRDNPALSRFELTAEGATALAYYRLADGVLTFTHTEVPPQFRQRGIASRLVIYLASHWREVDPKVLERWGEVARAVRKAG